MANREILDSNFIIYERYLPNPYPYPAQGGGSQTLAQTLALGNTSGANHIVMDAGQNVDVTGGEVFAGTLNVVSIEPLAPAFSTDIGIEGSLVFPGPIEMRNNGGSFGVGLTIDSIPSAVAPNANILGYDTFTHQITHQPALGGEDLAQTLAIGNTSGANDILMDVGQKISVETITDTQNITGNAVTGGINVKTLSNNNRLELSDITRTANLTAKFGNREYQHYSDSLNQKTGISFIDPLVNYNRKVEVGIDINGPYTKMIGLDVPPAPLPSNHILTWDISTEKVHYDEAVKDITVGVKGDYTVQDLGGFITPASFNDERIYLFNKYIMQSNNIAWQELYPGNTNPCDIPFFLKNGNPYPGSIVYANTNPWGLGDYPDSNFIVRSIVPDPHNKAIIYVGATFTPAGRGIVFSFDCSINQWNSIAYVDGEINAIFYDDDIGNTGPRIYVGGSFNLIEGQGAVGSPVPTKNVAYYEINSAQAFAMPNNGLNGPVNCFERFMNYIAIGGDFNSDTVGVNLYQYFAFYDGGSFTNIGFTNSGTSNDYGFDGMVQSIVALPQINGLVIGGRFNQQFYAGGSTSYPLLTRLFTYNGFGSMGDGSLAGGEISNMLRDYDGGRLYVCGGFTTSNGDNFVALDINTLDAYYNMGYSNLNFKNFSTLAKDEIGGFIWIMNSNDGSIYRFNPVVRPTVAYEDIGSLIGVTPDYGSCVYNPFDSAIHFTIRNGATYYRYFCDQRIKVNVPGGDVIIDNGNTYDVIVLPKKGSSVVLRGGQNTPHEWYISGPTKGVYLEWRQAQITQVQPAWGSAFKTQKELGISNYTVEFDTFNFTNINSGANSSKIVVPQKGRYKVSYTIQWRSGSGTIDAEAWLLVNGEIYQGSKIQETLIASNDLTIASREVFVELNENDFVAVRLQSQTGNLEIIATGASPVSPAIPAVQLNISLEQPNTQFFASL